MNDRILGLLKTNYVSYVQGNCQTGLKGEKGERGLPGMPAQQGESSRSVTVNPMLMTNI